MTDAPNHPNGRLRDGPGTPGLRNTARAGVPASDDSCSAFVNGTAKGVQVIYFKKCAVLNSQQICQGCNFCGLSTDVKERCGPRGRSFL